MFIVNIWNFKQKIKINETIIFLKQKHLNEVSNSFQSKARRI